MVKKFKRWTNEEKEILENNYCKGTEYCEKLLSRPISSIRKIAQNRKLHVDKKVRVEINRKNSHANWKEVRKRLQGKKKLTKKGYITIKDYTHPNRNNNNSVFEHIKVITKHLGRALEKGEIVHHIDFNKANNKIENLYLCKNAKEHAEAHWSSMRLAKELLQDKIIFFKKGKYYKK